MKSSRKKFYLRPACFLCVLCASVLNCFSLDREVFSITSYDLDVRVEPEQHRLGVRGKITLRNDASTPQKIAVLQISSSLDWRSIKAAEKPLQYVTQPYTSDIDHTGSLSEAIVTLPQEIAPHATIALGIAYEGVVRLDATRLIRIGTPEDAAMSSDWDQIDPAFTALRGAGYVAWYPIATDVANLSEGNSLFEALGRWRSRETGSQMRIALHDPNHENHAGQGVMVCSGEGTNIVTMEATARFQWAQCSFKDLAHSAPSFALANYGTVQRPSITVDNLPTHAAAAEAYADAAEKVSPLITDWFGRQRERVQIADLADPQDVPFESGVLLFTPLANSNSPLIGLSVAHQLTHASFLSLRPWIEEGLAHFAQVLYLERQKGRPAALDYMSEHRNAFSSIDAPGTLPPPESEASRSLVNSASEELYRSKAMCVWWMLRDMLGDAALKKAIAAYRPEQDKDPSYMPRLISAQTQRDLEWFFDDWVYRDRGLPDFKVESAYARKTLTNSYMLTITLDNQGTAGAEVPVAIKSARGEVVKRIEVRARSKATIRVETPAPPQEVQVNDGSVPESDLTNNTFKVDTPQN